MSAYDSWELRLAWQIARQLRCCPPDGLVLAENPDENVMGHLEVCTFCRELRQMGGRAMEAFELVRRLAPGCEAKAAVAVAEGQVWLLRESLAGWGPRRLFYNPPVVLILSPTTGPGDGLKVAQVYDDARLAGPGDLSIEEGLFAETWNTYTLRTTYLDRLLTTVPTATVQAVLDLEAKEFLPLDEHTPLSAFRRLEIEVGAFFSMKAVSELLSACEPRLTAFLEEAFPEEGTLIARIERTNPRIAWAGGGLPLLDQLALARFPDDELPLAASSPHKTVPVNILQINTEGTDVNLVPGIAVLSVWRDHEDGLLVGGRLQGTLMEEAELTARLELPEGELRAASTAFLDATSGHFGVFFPEIESGRQQQGRLHLVVLTR